MGAKSYGTGYNTVRLSPSYYDGKSLTAVAVAAHEVGHAIQFQRRESLIQLRTRLYPIFQVLKRVGAMALVTMPLVTAIVRVPQASLIMLMAGASGMLVSVLFHLVTLPVEWDASFGKALPILTRGRYIDPTHEPAVRRILHAAALTYVAVALADLLNLWRWLRLLRR